MQKCLYCDLLIYFLRFFRANQRIARPLGSLMGNFPPGLARHGSKRYDRYVGSFSPQVKPNLRAFLPGSSWALFLVACLGLGPQIIFVFNHFLTSLTEAISQRIARTDIQKKKLFRMVQIILVTITKGQHVFQIIQNTMLFWKWPLLHACYYTGKICLQGVIPCSSSW